ncbi:PASTA domain-containing protein [Streptomyces sp. NPDC002088]|uniref:PASTA domain-containing protein n=1 Tax=Streptomyces sp. NPDC002088 TaxID=3154665 RepID=UPI0033276EE1
MANWKIIGGIAGGVLVLGAIGNAIGSNDNTSNSTAATSSSAPTANSSTTSSDAKASNSEKKAVPNFIGMGLQSAQDTAQTAGFYSLTSHDSLGRDRLQALDRNWKVCSQNVAAGKTVATDTEFDFGAVKLDETCPKTDQAEPAEAGGTMPDFKGKSVKAARAALDSGTSITVTDASSDDRFVLVESNWQVCAQTPKAGAKLSGQPVEFGAVKFGETCP